MTSPPLIVGVDPGLSGAVAFLAPTDPPRVQVFDMPVHEIKGRKKLNVPELARIVDLYAGSTSFAVIEDVHSMPKQGVASSFAFGLATGVIHGVLGAHFIPVQAVTPTRWKRAFNLSSDKDASRRLATQMFPRDSALFARKKDDGRAEAVLIAVWAAAVMYKLGEKDHA